MKQQEMKMKKGQASIEYLTTYGWVFLIMIVGIGALAYYGFLSPSNFVPNRCWFGSQFVCEDYSLRQLSGTQGEFLIRMRNNFARDVRLETITGVDAKYSLSGCNAPLDIGIGLIEEIRCNINASLYPGDKHSIPIRLSFRRNDTAGTPVHDIIGELYTRVE